MEVMEELIKEAAPYIVPAIFEGVKTLLAIIKEKYNNSNRKIPQETEQKIIEAEENNKPDELINIIKELIKDNFIVNNNQQINNVIGINVNGSKEVKTITQPSDNELLSILTGMGIKEKEELNALFSDRELMNSFKQKGIFNIAKEGDYSKLKKMIGNAKTSIKTLAYYGDGILYGLQTDIINAINNSKDKFNVQLLFAQKESALLYEVLKLENISIANIEAKRKEKYDKENGYIIDIKEKRKNELCSIEIKEYNTQVRYAITIIDEEWAWWTPYHPGIRTEDCISFELVNKGENSFFYLCNRHFDKLWTEGKIRV